MSETDNKENWSLKIQMPLMRPVKTIIEHIPDEYTGADAWKLISDAARDNISWEGEWDWDFAKDMEEEFEITITRKVKGQTIERYEGGGLMMTSPINSCYMVYFSPPEQMISDE